MNNGNGTTKRLAKFGLTEKEAQLYLHLLRFGPKQPTELRKSLKTYREDIHRRLTGLIAKSMIGKGVDNASLYIAADLDTALNAQLLTRHHELHQLEAAKRELEELLEGQQFRIADDVFTYKILKTVREVATSISQLIRSAETQIAIIAPPRTLNLIFMVGSHDQQKRAAERGVRLRVITDISRRNIEMARDHLDVGVALRHINQYRGITGIVADGKQSISLIHADPEASLSLDEHVTMLWSDSPEHATHLMETFEMAWAQAIDADEQVRALAREERVATTRKKRMQQAP
jgi:sugar-specific transcriptional regulator TrmB